MKRRPEQLSILKLMGLPETAGERYERTARIIPGSDRVDADGNVLNVTVVCDPFPESEDSDPWWDQPVPTAYEE